MLTFIKYDYSYNTGYPYKCEFNDFCIKLPNVSLERKQGHAFLEHYLFHSNFSANKEP